MVRLQITPLLRGHISIRLSSRYADLPIQQQQPVTNACQFPFNNACSTHNSMLTNLNITGLKVEVARDTHRHVKKTLPPSLASFPGEAEIKYFVKATIIRPQFYKENIRTVCPMSAVDCDGQVQLILMIVCWI